jgi:hypothetical protein
VALQAAHRPEPGLQPALICLDRIIGMLLHDVRPSRAVISASSRVRSSSSGAHRWVFAVISSSGRGGASWRA